MFLLSTLKEVRWLHLSVLYNVRSPSKYTTWIACMHAENPKLQCGRVRPAEVSSAFMVVVLFQSHACMYFERAILLELIFSFVQDSGFFLGPAVKNYQICSLLKSINIIPRNMKEQQKKRPLDYLLSFSCCFFKKKKKKRFFFLFRFSSARDYPRPYTNSRFVFGHSRGSRSRRRCTSSRFGFAGLCSCSRFGLPFLPCWVVVWTSSCLGCKSES